METPEQIVPQVVVQEFVPTDALKVLEKTIWRTGINGLLYFANRVFEDERGYFVEATRPWEISAITGRVFHTEQGNKSLSYKKALRGIHSEGQDKLASVTVGSAFCALVDLRPDSSTFLHVELITLHESTGLYIPEGVGNSFCVLSEVLYYSYLVTKIYADLDKEENIAIDPFDPDLGIPWPYAYKDMLLSIRDLDKAISLRKYLNQKR
ncbi:dTDP-4-dehydrorhamnose 3,5-epimerase family protein [Patescibacteria group bacterium]